MFTEYLRSHPLQPEALRGLSLKPDFPHLPDAVREEIAALERTYNRDPYPMRLASDFLAFSRSGSRSRDETPYFARRRKLCSALLGCCIGLPALDDVIDGILCICEESSWVISAHNVNPIPGAPSPQEYPLPDVEDPYVDLFSAQTGMILSFVFHLLQDELDRVSPLLCRRILREMENRIIIPFMTRDDFWWMGIARKDLCNWTPWILSNILYCAFLTPRSDTMRCALLTRALPMLDRWLAVLPEDGGCDEGAGYWNMAGGALLDILEILEIVTDGQVTFWDNEKVRNILSFPVHAHICGSWFANFADCDARPFLSGERLQFAGEKTGSNSLKALGHQMRGTLADQLSDVPRLSRLISMLLHPDFPVPSSPDDDAWLPDLQFCILRRGSLTLCAKGGNNGESHNHNDVGSFMLYANGEPVLVDAGNMLYTAKTFSSERYTLWNTRSAYHNLPLIGGEEECPGSAYRATSVRKSENTFSMHLEEAYPQSLPLTAYRRSLQLFPDQAVLHDVLDFEAPTPVSYILMLRHPPVLEGRRITTGPICFSVPDAVAVSVEEIPVTDPRMARSFPGSLYRLILSAPAACCQSLTLHFSLCSAM